MSTFTEPSRWRVGALCLFLALLASRAAAQTPPACQPEWIPTFGGHPSPSFGSMTVQALAVFDDGHGPVLHAAGDSGLGSTQAFVSKWTGWGWTNVASPFVGSEIRALAVFDSGTGPVLYVGGDFTSIVGVGAHDVARWDGSNWAALGSGTNGAWVRALRVFDDGSGPALFVGGEFTSAGGIAAQNLARWNGSSWSAIAAGMNAGIEALCEFDDGSGPALFAGGLFTTAGGQACNRIAKWDGTNWSPLGSGLSGGVQALAVFDDGTGRALFAGGSFITAGGSAAFRVAKWDGANWTTLGSGASGPVHALGVFDDGSGPGLFAGGSFATAGGIPVGSIAKWDGTSWAGLAGGVNQWGAAVHAFATYDDGQGAKLEVGGSFGTAGGMPAVQVAGWGPGGWSARGTGLDGDITAMASYDDGTGKALYVGGSLQHAGGFWTRSIAKWDGSHWSILPPAFFVDTTVWCMTVFDDGNGPALYASEEGSSGPLRRWDGTSWSNVGTTPGGFRALQVFDDGSGPALFGSGGLPNRIYRWTGSAWVTVGGMAGGGLIRTLAVFDDGSGPALYAGGDFTSIDGQPVSAVARWNGTTWIGLGPGLGGTSPYVSTLQVFDDGGASALYAGGRFDTAGGLPSLNIARWDGASWSALGSGIRSSGPGVATVRSLAVFDAVGGPGLYVAGSFDAAGGTPSNGLACWTGTSWSDLGLGLDAHAPNGDTVGKLFVADDGSPTGRALLAGGTFVGDEGGDSFLAKWDLPLGCMPLGTSFCAPGTGVVMPCPCSNPAAGPNQGCDNSSATGGAQLVAMGLASLSNDVVRLASSGEVPSALSVFVQGTNTIAGGVLFGQGVRCLSGALTRLYTKAAVNGSALAPEASDTPVSVRSLALGDPIVAGQHRYYGVYYRDPIVLGGCPATSTFNITQQADLLWTP